MADCEKLNVCPFFGGQLAEMPAATELMKTNYCRGDKTRCARYRVASAKVAVPGDLYPHELDRALKLIGERKGELG